MNRGFCSLRNPGFVDFFFKAISLNINNIIGFVGYVGLELGTLRNQGKGDTYKNNLQNLRNYKIYMYIKHLTCFFPIYETPPKPPTAEIRHFGLNSGVHA